MNKKYIAVDIGASSGRLILGQIKKNKLSLKEIHRFKNGIIKKNGNFYWNVEELFDEILIGLKNIKGNKEDIKSIGIDTWGVDYVIINENGELLNPTYAYRDNRTSNTIKKVLEEIDIEKIYTKTGIQFVPFNTLYQLYEHVREDKTFFEKGNSIMLIPDYLNYRLTGIKSIEYTNATTTQLINLKTKEWDEELLKIIGIDKNLFPKIMNPISYLGNIRNDIGKETGMKSLEVVLPATHDTGSAIVSVPTNSKNYAYISSGTWSLMGVETKDPINTKDALKANFTNEGGVFETYRVLKNIMGLWIIQEVVRNYDNKYSFAEIVKHAENAEGLKYFINPNDLRFINPINMIEEIKEYCRETKQGLPASVGEISRCVFESLAFLYKDTLIELESLTNFPLDKIHIIGGGCQNKLLNQLCADFTKKEVHSGPIEGTAIGNILAQILHSGEIKNLNEAREIVGNSFEIEVFKPSNKKDKDIDIAYKKFREIKNG